MFDSNNLNKALKRGHLWHRLQSAWWLYLILGVALAFGVDHVKQQVRHYNNEAFYLPNLITGGVLGWLIGKGCDYVVAHWNDPSGCGPGSCVGNASMDGQGAPGSVGGGGGSAF